MSTHKQTRSRFKFALLTMAVERPVIAVVVINGILFAINLSVGIWIELSLSSLVSNVSNSTVNATSIESRTEEVKLLRNADYLLITVGALGATIFTCALIMSSCCGAKSIKTFNSTIGSISGALLLAAGICACVFLANLNRQMWTESEVQSLISYSVAIIVLTFGWSGILILLLVVLCCLACGACCCALCKISRAHESVPAAEESADARVVKA